MYARNSKRTLIQILEFPVCSLEQNRQPVYSFMNYADFGMELGIQNWNVRCGESHGKSCQRMGVTFHTNSNIEK
jgi:hypothetical protein